MHRWEAWSKDSLKVISPSGKCHSLHIFESHHHQRGAISDLLHDPRGLVVKLADSDTRQSEYYVYTVRLPWDKSDMTLVLGRYRTSYQSLMPAALGTDIRRYLPRTRVISYTYGQKFQNCFFFAENCSVTSTARYKPGKSSLS